MGSRAGLHWRLLDWSVLGLGVGAAQRYVCANHQNLQEKMRTGLNFYKEVSTAMALCFPRTCGQCPFSLLHICKGEEGKE